jgi:hypothetical protein
LPPDVRLRLSVLLQLVSVDQIASTLGVTTAQAIQTFIPHRSSTSSPPANTCHSRRSLLLVCGDAQRSLRRPAAVTKQS